MRIEDFAKAYEKYGPILPLAAELALVKNRLIGFRHDILILGDDEIRIPKFIILQLHYTNKDRRYWPGGPSVSLIFDRTFKKWIKDNYSKFDEGSLERNVMDEWLEEFDPDKYLGERFTCGSGI